MLMSRSRMVCLLCVVWCQLASAAMEAFLCCVSCVLACSVRSDGRLLVAGGNRSCRHCLESRRLIPCLTESKASLDAASRLYGLDLAALRKRLETRNIKVCFANTCPRVIVLLLLSVCTLFMLGAPLVTGRSRDLPQADEQARCGH